MLHLIRRAQRDRYVIGFATNELPQVCQMSVCCTENKHRAGPAESPAWARMYRAPSAELHFFLYPAIDR